MRGLGGGVFLLSDISFKLPILGHIGYTVLKRPEKNMHCRNMFASVLKPINERDDFNKNPLKYGHLSFLDDRIKYFWFFCRLSDRKGLIEFLKI